MKKDYAWDAVKNFAGFIFSIFMTSGYIVGFFDSVSKKDTFDTIVCAFFVIIFGFCIFGCAYSFIDNLTSAIAEKSKRD